MLIRADGLRDGQVRFNNDVVSKIIESYTRESGVRNLEREIGSVCRAKAVEYAEAKDAEHTGKSRLVMYHDTRLTVLTEQYNPTLTVPDIEKILGMEKYDEEIAEKSR